MDARRADQSHVLAAARSITKPNWHWPAFSPRRGADRGRWRSALSLVPHRTITVARNATASPLVDCFSNRAAVMPSTSIRKMEYDLDRRTLSVWFVASGTRYEFEGVPPETFAAFRAAFAKGRYFNDHIRNCFRYHLVASDSDPG
ncbi:KTSC domain-containing protein [Mesorhizobium sp. M0296]|uniref:KTSC domain-containing protein n=1 Tax=Mesorhizobium sp. M0296 TaxID=2956931 RepID=UPI0033377429